MKIKNTFKFCTAVIALSLVCSCASKTEKFSNKLCDCFSKYSNSDALNKASANDQKEIKKCFQSVWNEIKEYENSLNQDEKEKFEGIMDSTLKSSSCSSIVSNIDLETMLSNTDVQPSNNTDNSTSIDYGKVSSENGNDWNKIIDDYGTFIDQYIELLKKAKNGDASAMSDYPDVMQKAQDLGEQLQNAQSDLTPEQASKFLKLQEKLSQAALQIAGQ